MVEQLWNAYRRDPDFEALEQLCRNGTDWLYLSVLAFAAGADDAAARYATTAAAQPGDSLVLPAAAQYLTKVGKQGRQQVYTQPEGFAAFIRGGGNVTLYRRLSAELARRYRTVRPARLLDIGVGDGLALLPALTDDVGAVDLLEPSPALLSGTAAALTEHGLPHRAATATAQDLVTGVDAWPDDTRWELAQSTFALHNLERTRRREVLARLRGRVDRLLIAEFGLAPGRATEPDWFDYVVTRYEAGLAEYDGDGGLVAQGFLMPVMFGYFDPDTVHHEQSVADWRADLTDAGFTESAEPLLLHDYWWAPGYLFDVR